MPKTAKKTASKKTRRQPDRLIARLVVIGAADFTERGANDIADWLVRQARTIRSRSRKRLASRFTARYFAGRGR